MATKGKGGRPRDERNNRPNKSSSPSSGGKNSISTGTVGHSKGGNSAPHATPPKSSTTNSSGGGSGGINAGNSYGASAGGHSSSSSSSSSSSRGSSSSSRSSSSSSAAALANARAQAQLRERQAQQEAQRKKVEQQAYANLLQTKYNRSGSSGVQKNPNTGTKLGGSTGADYTFRAAMTARNQNPLPSGGYTQAKTEEITKPASTSTAPISTTQNYGASGMYASDRWGGPDGTVVLDLYGNYITQGKLNELKAQGYYDNWKEKAHSLDGTDKTYGWQYAVGNSGDPSGYGSAQGNGIYSSNSLPQFGDEDYFYTGLRDNGMLDAQDAYTDAAVQAYRDQIPLINQNYDGVAQEAYAAYMRARSGLPEQASGMATGMADSLLTQNDLTYQNNLSANELARAAALADLNTQAAQAQAEGELQKAQYQAQLEQQAYERKLELMRMAQQQALAAAKTQGGGGSVASPQSSTNDTGSSQETEPAEQSPAGTNNALIDNWITTNIKNRFGNNITYARIQSAINDAYGKGQITLEQAKLIAAKYGMTL